MYKFVVLAMTACAGLSHPMLCSSTNSQASDMNDSWNIPTLISSGHATRNQQINYQIQKNFTLEQSLSKKELYRMVENAVNEANPHRMGLDGVTDEWLSHQVVHTADCYGVDPVVFTALIWRESNFKPDAVSERGAVGLTQLTQTGIKEVLDRLGEKSHRRLKDLRQTVRRCSPALFERLPAISSADTVAAWKNSAAFSISQSLVLGAVLLKLNLASHRPGPGLIASQKMNWYQRALERYNGDPKVKDQFSKDVVALTRRLKAAPEIVLNDSGFQLPIR